ncbi:MAG: UbiX family flavin prenyltransferase [Clostridiales Family XIII bacterium]|jgi:polyprenyl P-hydroxybenzoate/phenylacrylic acid decarboxylase-like protein|nr:UbiX family flavin prenyltransferase [Clostridiales Family XIII bacterium]
MRIAVGISGASGAIYGIRLLEGLRSQGVETHLVISPWGSRTILEETGMEADAVRALASCSYGPDDLDAGISSGSFPLDGMAVAPCSMKTLAAIASGYSGDLIARAADVCLKERRRLVLAVRETPLSRIHLENMLRASDAGAVIMPPVPAFYTKPGTIDELVSQYVGRVMEQLGLRAENLKRWKSD